MLPSTRAASKTPGLATAAPGFPAAPAKAATDPSSSGLSCDSPRPRLLFRRADQRDLPAVQELYRQIIDHAGRTGDPARWHKYGHPSPKEVTRGIRAGHLYVVVNVAAAPLGSELAGAGFLNGVATAGYQHVAWPTGARAEESLVLHALGVSPEHLRKGVARFFLAQAVALGARLGKTALRLETFADNTPALRLYRGYGFVDVGTHKLEEKGLEHENFQLFELPLK